MNFTYQFVKRLEKFVLWLFVADCADMAEQFFKYSEYFCVQRYPGALV